MPEPEHPNAADDALADMPALLAANAAALAYLRRHHEQLVSSYCSPTTGGGFSRPSPDADEEAHPIEVEALIAQLSSLPPPPAFTWPASGILDMSTSHITYAASELIGEWARQERDIALSASPVRCGDHQYGWFIAVPKLDPDGPEVTDEELRELDLHKALGHESIADIWAYARKRGCAYILLDSDGETYDDLPTYEW